MNINNKPMIIKEDQKNLVMIALRVLYEDAITKKRDLQPSRIKQVYEELFGNDPNTDNRKVKQEIKNK
jgi:hypothetical protein